MTQYQPSRKTIAEDAARLLIDLDREDVAGAKERLYRWLCQGPEYVEEFLFAYSTYASLGELGPHLRLSLQEVADSVVVRFPGVKIPPAISSGGSRRTREMRWLGAAAAGIVLIVSGIGVAYWWSLRGQTYSTAVGSQQTIKLSDGSILLLNTDSRVHVHLSADMRSIRLARGEALFTVAHDSTRPFIVEAGRASVRAIGTAFNVRTGDRTTRVAVLEGVVQVSRDGAKSTVKANPEPSAVRLQAGDEAEVTDTTAIKLPVSNVLAAVAWRNRRLVFESERADVIAGEFNRYNAVPIRIEGETLRSQPMGGTFDADDPAPLIRYLSRLPNVEVIHGEREIMIRMQRSR